MYWELRLREAAVVAEAHTTPLSCPLCVKPNPSGPTDGSDDQAWADDDIPNPNPSHSPRSAGTDRDDNPLIHTP